MSFVQRLRVARVERQELGIRPRTSKSATTKHFLVYVHSPLEEMQAWHNKIVDKPERILSPNALPMRYHQTLLFADELGDTHPNPALSKAS